MRGVFVALLALPILAVPVAADTVPINPREVRQNLFATCSTSADDGWVVGELGRVFHTADGGKTWERQDTGTKRPFLAISCLDARTAWIAGKEGIVYGTTDGGDTWKPAVTGSNRHIFALHFPTRERGHAAGDFGTMVHTEDAGAHWTVQRVPPEVKLPESALDTGVDPGDVNLYGISYADPERAWLVGEFGIIMTSADGGLTWTQQHSPVETTLFGVSFTDAHRGWAVGSDAVILRTEDGGVSWRPQQGVPIQRPFYDVAVRGEFGWIVGEAGTVLKSTDAGQSWALEPLPIQLAANWIRSIWLAADGRGFAVGAEGLAFRIDGPSLRRLAADAARPS